jgi:hypothetical protein
MKIDALMKRRKGILIRGRKQGFVSRKFVEREQMSMKEEQECFKKAFQAGINSLDALMKELREFES